jgi:hypothetical protein
MDAVVKRRIPNPPPGVEPRIIQPVAQCYTTELSRLHLYCETLLKSYFVVFE